jgi:hypothetical protein
VLQCVTVCIPPTSEQRTHLVTCVCYRVTDLILQSNGYGVTVCYRVYTFPPPPNTSPHPCNHSTHLWCYRVTVMVVQINDNRVYKLTVTALQSSTGPHDCNDATVTPLWHYCDTTATPLEYHCNTTVTLL